MANLNILVQDGNNINVEVTPTPRQTITVDRGVSGVGIESVSIVLQDSTYYFEFTYTNGTTELVPLPAITTGVVSFNTRIGVVTLTSTDVTGALGYTPPTPTGTGASGTWNIAVSGNAANVTGVVALVNGGTGATTQAAARTNLGLGTSAVLNAAVALGTATLDASGTVPLSQIPASIQGGLNYQGTWNASTNTPTLTSSVGSKGYYYAVSVAGSTNLNGITDWNIGDLAVYNGTAWEQIDNTDAVTSVNGFTGSVVLTTTNVAEGTNEYFTTAKARSSVSAGTGITYNSTTGVITNSLPSLGGDVTGAASSTDNAVARFNGTTGKAIQNSSVIIDDSNNVSGVATLNAANLIIADNTTLGASNTDTVAVNGRITTDLDPNTNNAHDIGTSGRNWRDGFFGRNLQTVNLAVTGTTSYDGAQGTSGQVLTSAGTGNTPTWTTPTVGTVTSVAASAGTGISVTGSPITTSGTLVVTNTAPDQVVGLTGAGTTSITGTYPNFTITSNDEFDGDVTGAASSTDNAIVRFDGTTGKLLKNSSSVIDDLGNVGIGTVTPTAKLDVNGNSVMIGSLNMTSNAVMPTSNGVSGIGIQNTATKTYPTTSGFIASPGLKQNLELGTAQTVNSVTPGGFNYVYGIENTLTKSAGNTQDIDRLYFGGIGQFFTWTDLNTCQQYNSFLDQFLYYGINANGRTTSFIGCPIVRLVPPNGGTQTISTVVSANLIAAATALTANVNITTAYGYNPTLRTNALTSGALTTAIGTYTFYDTGSNFGSNATGTAVNSTTITNLYGLRLRSPSVSFGLTVTNNWGISQEWGSARNVFAGQTSIGGLLGAESLRVTPVVSAVNYVNVSGAITGAAPSITATGTDTNIDLTLAAKGTGLLQFGTYAAGALTQTGYITIKDAAGNTRNLLVG